MTLYVTEKTAWSPVMESVVAGVKLMKVRTVSEVDQLSLLSCLGVLCCPVCRPDTSAGKAMVIKDKSSGFGFELGHIFIGFQKLLLEGCIYKSEILR